MGACPARADSCCGVARYAMSVRVGRGASATKPTRCGDRRRHPGLRFAAPGLRGTSSSRELALQRQMRAAGWRPTQCPSGCGGVRMWMGQPWDPAFRQGCRIGRRDRIDGHCSRTLPMSTHRSRDSRPDRGHSRRRFAHQQAPGLAAARGKVDGLRWRVPSAIALRNGRRALRAPAASCAVPSRTHPRAGTGSRASASKPARSTSVDLPAPDATQAVAAIFLRQRASTPSSPSPVSIMAYASGSGTGADCT
jgi:hypothetical protein